MSNTPEDAAARILGLFQAHGIEPDQPQMLAGLKPLFVKDGFAGADLDAGVKFAIARGWLERAPGGSITLTLAGAAAMPD